MQTDVMRKLILISLKKTNSTWIADAFFRNAPLLLSACFASMQLKLMFGLGWKGWVEGHFYLQMFFVVVVFSI